jgi:macrolide-specific efflux system membrane fusion protein
VPRREFAVVADVEKVDFMMLRLLPLVLLFGSTAVVAQESPQAAPVKDSAENRLEASDDETSEIQITAALLKTIEIVAVPAEQAGLLTQLDIKEGLLLKKGDFIGKVKDEEVRLRLKRAQLEHDIAKRSADNDVDIRFYAKAVEVSQAEVDRAAHANARVANSVPLAEVEALQLARDKALLQQEQADRDFAIAKQKVGVQENEIKLIEELLARYQIYAPIDAMVVAIETRAGEWVAPGQTVARLVRIDRLRVEGFISAYDASRIKIGEPIEISFTQPWLKDKHVAGEIVFINPETNPVNNNVQVWGEVPNIDLVLKPGMRVNMKIVVKREKGDLDQDDLSLKSR